VNDTLYNKVLLHTSVKAQGIAFSNCWIVCPSTNMVKYFKQVLIFDNQTYLMVTLF